MTAGGVTQTGDATASALLIVELVLVKILLEAVMDALYASLWIVFKRDIVIQLKQELIMNNFKTIDARGVNVHIANGDFLTIQYVTNIIIHGLYIHDCKPTGNALVKSSPPYYGWWTMVDGDAFSIFGSSHIWAITILSLTVLMDSWMLSWAQLLSPFQTIFTHHNEVVLLTHAQDKLMQVTITYNHFWRRSYSENSK
nr:probable pectate lyase 8 [Tanacetum cinerariifolium]